MTARRVMASLVIVAALGLASISATARPTTSRRAATAPPTPAIDAPTAPVLPEDTGWLKGVLITVGGLFAAAALIGPIYRLNLPDELMPTHSHDEPPGSSHHHGPSGTVDFSAPDRHR